MDSPEDVSPPPRKIIHVDMDAFFASVEQRDNPGLRGRPVAVGSSSLRGVVAAASYEARAFGVYSAMPSVTAKRKCPELIFVPGRFDAYRAVSRQIRDIFEDYTPLVEPLSLDEAYLDVTENHKGMASATDIAKEIRARIFAATQLTASAGVSYNKFLAKIASDQNKPNGLCVIRPDQGASFAATLPVRKFHGIGPATAAKMQALGIETGADLRSRDLEFLIRHFGVSGRHYYHISRGIDDRAVRPDRERKSIGAENTFSSDISAFEPAWTELEPLVDKVWRNVEKHEVRARTVTLKVKFADFQIVTRSRTGGVIDGKPELIAAVNALLLNVFPVARGIRLLGVSLSNLHGPEEDAPQLSLEF